MISVRASELFPAGILTQESLSISVSLRAHDADSRCRVRVPVDNQRARAQVLRHRDMPLRTSIPEIPY